MTKIGLAIHGGAGTITRANMTSEMEAAYKQAMQFALDAGYKTLDAGGDSVLAVEVAVKALEDNPLFNAGKGSVFTNQGRHEMDASIMDGKTKGAGAVSAITGVKNPISLARLVMEQSNHVYLTGTGAEEFARKVNCEFKDKDYFFNELRYNQWQQIKDSTDFQLDHSQNKDRKFGTVGAVALDKFGNIAAATSTGGMTNKRYGRVGDSPIIGAGNYANNKTCAVSCTGSGEFFIRGVVAYDVSCLIEYKNLSLEQACHEVIHQRLPEIGGDGGLIAIDVDGNITLSFNTEGMYRGKRHSNGINEVLIYNS